MKRRNSGYILAVVVISLCTHVVYFVSVTTDSWLLAEVRLEDEQGVKLFRVSYGLNEGQISNGTDIVALTILCLVEVNACAWTCNSLVGTSQVDDLYYLGKMPKPCFEGTNNEGNSSLSVWCMRDSFIPATLWLAALALLLTSGIVSLIALSLTIYNVNHMPSNYWLSIGSLYVWFPASSVLSLLGITVWVLLFHLKLKKTLGMVDTIVGYLHSTDNVQLGFSMWWQVCVVCSHGGCVALLRFRENLFDRRLLTPHPSRLSHLAFPDPPSTF